MDDSHKTALLMRSLGIDLQRDWPWTFTYHMPSRRGALWESRGHWEPFPSFHKDMIIELITTALPLESISHVQARKDSNIVLWGCSRPVHDCVRPVGWIGKRLVLKMMDGEGRAPRNGLGVTSGGKSGTHQWRKMWQIGTPRIGSSLHLQNPPGKTDSKRIFFSFWLPPSSSNQYLSGRIQKYTSYQSL